MDIQGKEPSPASRGRRPGDVLRGAQVARRCPGESMAGWRRLLGLWAPGYFT